jgi:hypothetical protein
MMLHHHLVDRDPMRLVLAFLFVVATVGLASAQGNTQAAPNKSDEVLRQRILLKERFNKGWDVQIENAQDQGRVEGRCKAEARRRFSVLHPMKRRKFVRDCVERKGR